MRIIKPKDQHQRIAEKLASVGVKVIRRSPLAMQCETCAVEWTARLTQHGLNVKGYWKCPKGCNRFKTTDGRPPKTQTGIRIG